MILLTTEGPRESFDTQLACPSDLVQRVCIVLDELPWVWHKERSPRPIWR
jgi:hypothetical protein